MRQQTNRRLVEILNRLVENNPDLRFGQILSSYGFVEDQNYAGMGGPAWEDEFYTEPNEILKRVNKRVEDLNGQPSSTKDSK